MKSFNLGLSLILIGLSSSVVFAQSTTDGAIGGIVSDPSGAVVAHASVSVLDTATNAATKGETDGGGRYMLIHLQPGKYELQIQSPGLSPMKSTGVVVEVGRVTTFDARLMVAGAAEIVTVSDEAPSVNTSQQDFSTNINQTAIENLPINGRRWFNFVLLTPGTVQDGGFGDISFRGISGLLNNNTVDGGDNNQAFFSEEKGRTRIGYSLSQESIREFQVNTDTYSAEYGRSAGGVVNAVTKSGTNQIHGDLFYFNRNFSWGAYTPFATGPALVNGAYTQVPIKPVDIRQQFGGDVGGWLIKNKLFYYYNYDEQLRSFPAVATPSNPIAMFGPLTTAELTTLTNRLGPGTAANLTAAQIQQYEGQAVSLLSSLSGTVPRKGNQMLSFPKIDYRLNDRNLFTFSYNRLRWESPYGVQTNSVVARGIDSFGDDFVKADTGVARWSTVITPTTTNEFRFQYGRDFEYEFANPAHAGEPLNANGFAPDTSISGTTSFEFGQPYYTQRYSYPTEKRTQFADSVNWSHGTHLLKFGVDFNHVNDQIKFLNTGGGEYYYSNRTDFFSDYISSQIPSVLTATKGMVCGTAASPLQCYNEFQQGFGPLGFTFNTNEYAGFVQDQWRFSSRLTLNLGLRYEIETLPKAQIPNSLFPATGTLNPDKRDFGPRVGFAWDVNGNGKTSVRGGYGIYYGRIINGTLFQAISNTGAANAQWQLTLFPSTNGNVGPVYPTVLTTQSGTVSKPNIIFLPSDLRNPMIHEWDAVVEREISSNTVVSLSWIGSLGHFLPTPIDTNLPAPSTINYTISGGALNGDVVTVPFFKGARPNAQFNQITMISTSAHSLYNAGVVQIMRRMSHGLQFQASYTLADSRDNNAYGVNPTPTGNGPSNAYNIGLDEGPSPFDVRHRGVVSIVWQPRYFDKYNGPTRWLLSGWTFAPIVTSQSGQPFSPTVSGNPPSGLGNTGSGITGSQGSTRVPFLERNSFRYPAVNIFDLRISRAFRLKEGIKMELIGEAFNLLNHVNYTSATAQMFTLGGTSASPTLTYTTAFGQLTAANNNNVYTARQIQIGARVSF